MGKLNVNRALQDRHPRLTRGNGPLRRNEPGATLAEAENFTVEVKEWFAADWLGLNGCEPSRFIIQNHGEE